METHNIDSEIRRIFNESADFYDLEASKSKEKIWQQVQLKKQSRPNFYLLRTLAAACIFLFVTTFIIAISNIKADKKIKSLVELNNSLQNQINAGKENAFSQQRLLAETNNIVPDTVYVEKKVLVSKPVIKTKQIVDTIYVERKVYIEKEAPQELIAASDNNNPIEIDTSQTITSNSYDAQILIRNSNNVKQKKGRKLQIKFGGNRNPSNENTLAFTAKL